MNNNLLQDVRDVLRHMRRFLAAFRYGGTSDLYREVERVLRLVEQVSAEPEQAMLPGMEELIVCEMQ